MHSSLAALSLSPTALLDSQSESPAAPALAPTADRARVQQPLAATVPPELLIKIFEHAEDVVQRIFTQQNERLRQGEVCRSWHAAQIKRTEFIVPGDEQAARLASTFEADPVRASHATNMEVYSGGSYWSRLFPACTGLVEASVRSRSGVPNDALSMLPASLTKLKLDLSDFFTSPSFSCVLSLAFIPSRTDVVIELETPRNLAKALQPLQPVLGQIRRLVINAYGDQPRLLEPALLGMNAPEELELT